MIMIMMVMMMVMMRVGVEMAMIVIIMMILGLPFPASPHDNGNYLGNDDDHHVGCLLKSKGGAKNGWQ